MGNGRSVTLDKTRDRSYEFLAPLSVIMLTQYGNKIADITASAFLLQLRQLGVRTVHDSMLVS
jgi:hypothetical protein